MAVFKRWYSDRITPDHPKWKVATWWMYKRYKGKAIHRSLKGAETEEDALEIEKKILREVFKETTDSIAKEVTRKIVKPKGPQPEYVYVLESNGYLKIGRTLNLDKRLQAIGSTIVPFETRCIAMVNVPNARVAETRLHREFWEQRFRGEWFLLDKEQRARLAVLLMEVCGLGAVAETNDSAAA